MTAVVDSGWHKVFKFDAERGSDRLEVERITADSAEQRAGRAGRVAPGRVWRAWDRRDRLRPHREPEIRRIDLAGTVLDLMAWGGDPLRFEWFEAPSDEKGQEAYRLLTSELRRTSEAQIHHWFDEVEPQLDPAWRTLSGAANTSVPLTLEELQEVEATIDELLGAFVRRRDAGEAPAAARAVRFLRYTMPAAADE